MIMMKAPICNFCLTNSILCSSDQTKLDTGKISQLEIDVSRALYKLEKKHKAIANSKMLGAKSTDGIILILIESQIPFSMAEVLSLNDDISRAMSKNVRIIEKNAPINKIVQELLLPAKVAGVSNIWLPDGSSFIKVKLNTTTHKNGIRTYIEKLNTIVKDVLGVEIFLED
jgi:hypothetical protein